MPRLPRSCACARRAACVLSHKWTKKKHYKTSKQTKIGGQSDLGKQGSAGEQESESDDGSLVVRREKKGEECEPAWTRLIWPDTLQCGSVLTRFARAVWLHAPRTSDPDLFWSTLRRQVTGLSEDTGWCMAACVLAGTLCQWSVVPVHGRGSPNHSPSNGATTSAHPVQAGLSGGMCNFLDYAALVHGCSAEHSAVRGCDEGGTDRPGFS